MFPKNTKKVIVYYIDIDDEEKILDFIKEQNDTEIGIEFRDLKTLLSEVIISDETIINIK